jgi:hypothetical protein
MAILRVITYCLLTSIPTACLAEQFELLGRLRVPGDAADASGLTGAFDNGTPRNQLGGFSAIAYTGDGNRYLLLADRGPDDGAVPYGCRFHEVELSLPTTSQTCPLKIVKTNYLQREHGLFSGSAAEWEINDGLANRLDPEGLRIASDGTLFVSEEYGPSIFRFSADGVFEDALPVSPRFLIAQPALTKQEENVNNREGRQGNGGFEGLALSADGTRLTAILQGPLLQDHAFDDDGEDLGRNVRIMQIDLESAAQRQVVYPLEKAGYGVSEILNDGPVSFLVLERDSKPGSQSSCKAIFKINMDGATDVSSLDSLPVAELPANIKPVQKELFLDLQDERFGLADQLPKKIEGLAWGPPLDDGRKLLVICSDNDFQTEQPSEFYFFAVEP